MKLLHLFCVVLLGFMLSACGGGGGGSSSNTTPAQQSISSFATQSASSSSQVSSQPYSIPGKTVVNFTVTGGESAGDAGPNIRTYNSLVSGVAFVPVYYEPGYEANLKSNCEFDKQNYNDTGVILFSLFNISHDCTVSIDFVSIGSGSSNSSSSSSLPKMLQVVGVTVLQKGAGGDAGFGKSIHQIGTAASFILKPYKGFKTVAQGCNGSLTSGAEFDIYSVQDLQSDCTINVSFAEDKTIDVSNNYRKPGDYPQIPICVPFNGGFNAPFKVIFVNVNGTGNFESIAQSGVNELKELSPYSKYFSNMAFYKIAISGEFNCVAAGAELGTGFVCDSDKVNAAIKTSCGISDKDMAGIIKVAVVSRDAGATGGDVIYVADNPRPEMPYQKFVIAHEIGHNLGLADLYGGSCYVDGVPHESFNASYSRQFSNVDGPGCSKWCKAFKPASEYKSACLSLKTKSECLAYKRDAVGSCTSSNSYTGQYDACIWDENKTNDYFDSQCLPSKGTINIGVDCEEGTGCYYGAMLGFNSWRPNKYQNDDIMASGNASAFSPISAREVDQVLKCCASNNDSTAECATYRKSFSGSMENLGLKKALGSCQLLK